jgi:hypothetical protein
MLFPHHPLENKVSLTSPLDFLFECTLHLSFPSLFLSLCASVSTVVGVELFLIQLEDGWCKTDTDSRKRERDNIINIIIIII